MSLDVFPNIGTPDWGFGTDTEARVAVSSFGDGYELRRPDGINHLTDSWSPSWTSLDPSVADATYQWLRQRMKWKAFLWMHPTKNVQIQVVCESASVADEEFGRSTLRMNIRQDHNPA